MIDVVGEPISGEVSPFETASIATPTAAAVSMAWMAGLTLTKRLFAGRDV